MTQLELASNSQKIVMSPEQAKVMEQVMINGDLAALSAQDRLLYYKTVCESVGLNPFTKPFEYIELNGKLTLYAKKDATDQLRKIYDISIVITSREMIGDLLVVTARGTTKDGRTDEAIGAVPLVKEERIWVEGQNGRRGYYKGTGKYVKLVGDELANAMMKAETKAKRRVTLSLAGLGWLDESEVESIPDARVIFDGEAASSDSAQCSPQQSPAEGYYVVTGVVKNLIGADFKVNDKVAFYIELDNGQSVLIPEDHPVHEYLDKMIDHPFHFKVVNWNGKHAIAGGMEAIQFAEDAVSAPGKQNQPSDKPFILKSIERGNRPTGEPFAKMILVHQPTGQIFDVYALGEEQMKEVAKIQEGVPFQAQFNEMNGFRFIASVL
ncbi:hypothetical protein QO009_003040 [Brevibacillus aydinogluensis]|jgi:hypothetical protein|uniref:hypothetical protein n=1 Tax=Brevibacillus aydinogluensis TaxID=927786 RepID=UPI0028934EEF|nr:hypothetical protein [Brevibacillus aydinogluensis]MDT3417145.1 hypothetical protein [Brevibacillus aydinogluensis]